MITEEEIPRIQYKQAYDIGDTAPFPYSYTEKSQVLALKNSTPMVLDIDYTVSLAKTVTLLIPFLDTDTLTLYRKTKLDNQSKFPQDAKFNSEKINDCFDKVTMQQQEQSESINRSVKLPLDAPTSIQNLLIPIPVPNKGLKWSTTGTALINSDFDPDQAVDITKAEADRAEAAAIAASASETAAESAVGTSSASASAAAASAVSAASSAELAGNILVVDGNGKSFLANDGTYKTSGSIETQNKGTVSASFTAETNKAIIADITAPVTITLPVGLDSGIKNTIVIDFSSTVSALPLLSTTGTVCWSSLNNNNRPASCSTDSTQRNQLVLETLNGGVLWNAEFKTYKQRSSDTVIYGFYIDALDNNPATRVHYVQDNASFADPAYMNFTSDVFHYGDWANPFFFPRPVMLKYDGTEGYGLNVNDYTKKSDGTVSDVANPAYGGNAMTDWTTIYTKRYTEGNYQYVLKSNKQIDASWKAFSWFNKNNVLKEHCYMGIYQPANISSVLRSISGQTIFTNNAGATELAYALANGASYGWYTGVYSDWVEIQELLVLMAKSTDIQGKFGQGRSSAANAVTGECNTKGLFYGTAGNGPVKIFGIENLYGNYWDRRAGSVYTASGHGVKMTQGTADGSTATDYNSTGIGYIYPGLTMSGTSGGFINAATLTPYGFLPTAVSGSSSTYFCDGGWYAAGGYALVGGGYDVGLSVGAFALLLSNAFSLAGAAIGSALSCKPL